MGWMVTMFTDAHPIIFPAWGPYSRGLLGRSPIKSDGVSS
jgi:hypothetical protein